MNDWIRLLVKYKGKCSTCGKEIPAGQYALWSKSSKTIKHSECSAPQLATAEKRHADTTRQQPVVAMTDCFICGRSVNTDESGFIEFNSYDIQGISQAFVCKVCLKDKNAYENYQLAFIKRVHRVVKVKLG